MPRLMIQITVFSAIVVAVFTARTQAVVLVYEGFDYPTTASTTSNPPAPGDRSLSGVVLDPPAPISLGNGGGYTNPFLGDEKWFPININSGGATYNVAGDVDITSGSLSYSGLRASTGNQVAAAGLGYSPRLNFPDVPITGNTVESNSFNGSVFYSAIVQVNTMPGNPNGDPLISFTAQDNLSTGNTSAFFAGVFAKPNAATPDDPNDFLLGVSKGESVNGSFAVYDTTGYALGSTFFLVGEWEFVANVDPSVREFNDVARLYINPTNLGGTAAESGATVVTDVGGMEAGIANDLPLGSRSIKGIVIHQRNSSVPSYNVDEIRAGTTFADVTPPAIIELEGDYNGDGTVNAADYAVWRDTLGSTTDLTADGDGSLTIDQGDYNEWAANFGETAGAGSNAAVPEPGAVPLLISAAFLMLARFAHRKLV